MTNSKLIYLDNNATTKVDEKVVEVMLPYFSQYYGNPSSIYKFGGRNSKAVQEARETIKDFFGAKTAKEIFSANLDKIDLGTFYNGQMKNVDENNK